MAAVPYAGTVRVRRLTNNGRGSPTGPPVHLRFSADDVDGNAVTFDGLNDEASFTVPLSGYIIEDFTLRGAGEDTDSLNLRKGTSQTDVFLDNDLLADTSTDRASRLQGLLGERLEPGARYSFVQQA